MSKAERTKQYIIEKAAIILNEKGIAGTSIDDILRSAKIAKGSIYTYFENKEELTYACVDFLLQQLTEKRDELIAKHVTAKGKIYAIMELNKNPLYFPIDGGCPLVNFSTEADDTSPVIRKKVKATVDAYTKLYISILRQGIDAGEFSAHLIPEEYAMKMFMAIEGANAICRAINSAKPMQAVLRSLKSELEFFCPAVHK